MSWSTHHLYTSAHELRCNSWQLAPTDMNCFSQISRSPPAINPVGCNFVNAKEVEEVTFKKWRASRDLFIKRSIPATLVVGMFSLSWLTRNAMNNFWSIPEGNYLTGPSSEKGSFTNVHYSSLALGRQSMQSSIKINEWMEKKLGE